MPFRDIQRPVTVRTFLLVWKYDKYTLVFDKRLTIYRCILVCLVKNLLLLSRSERQIALPVDNRLHLRDLLHIRVVDAQSLTEVLDKFNIFLPVLT